jgi:hypothetical protein
MDARQRQKDLDAAEKAFLRVVGFLGKYDYTRRNLILTRLENALKTVRGYFTYELTGSEDPQDWQVTWHYNLDALTQAACFDGIVLLCTNVPQSRLSAAEALKKYKQQVSVEQTFDFIKSPIQIRPLWLHSPRRLAGLTLLIMLAVLIASLIEYFVRQEIAKNKKPLKGLMPENRDNPYPTAEKLLKTFQDYCFVVAHSADGSRSVHFPKPRPIQRQILDILAALPPTPS